MDIMGGDEAQTRGDRGMKPKKQGSPYLCSFFGEVFGEVWFSLVSFGLFFVGLYVTQYQTLHVVI